MHGDLPSGTVVSASERRGGALYKYPEEKEVKRKNAYENIDWPDSAKI